MQLEKVKSNINTYYTTGDLTYLYRSGRVSRTGMVIAHALNIWPILNLDLDGHLIVQAKERGKKKTIERIHKIISELCVDPEDQTLYICHSDIAEEASSSVRISKRNSVSATCFTPISERPSAQIADPDLWRRFSSAKKERTERKRI